MVNESIQYLAPTMRFDGFSAERLILHGMERATRPRLPVWEMPKPRTTSQISASLLDRYGQASETTGGRAQALLPREVSLSLFQGRWSSVARLTSLLVQERGELFLLSLSLAYAFIVESVLALAITTATEAVHPKGYECTNVCSESLLRR